MPVSPTVTRLTSRRLFQLLSEVPWLPLMSETRPLSHGSILQVVFLHGVYLLILLEFQLVSKPLHMKRGQSEILTK